MSLHVLYDKMFCHNNIMIYVDKIFKVLVLK